MGTNKKTTKTINRRTRHILKRDKDLGQEEVVKTTRRKKRGIKGEVKPVFKAARVDKKVKNWRQKQIAKVSKTVRLELTTEQYKGLMASLKEVIKILKNKNIR